MYLSPRNVKTLNTAMLIARMGTLDHFPYPSKPYCFAKESYSVSVKGSGKRRVLPSNCPASERGDERSESQKELYSWR